MPVEGGDFIAGDIPQLGAVVRAGGDDVQPIGTEAGRPDTIRMPVEGMAEGRKKWRCRSG